MNTAFSLLEDWEQTQDLLKELGLSKAHIKRHLSSKELKRPLRAKSELSISLDAMNPNQISPIFTGETPKLLLETDKYLVIHKPAGVHGHPLNYCEQDNVLAWMRANNFGKYLEVGKDSHERGLLYRLDQATSGVLIYVKEQSLWEKVRARFHNIAHLKRYVAIVDNMPEHTGELTAWFDLTGKKVKAFENHRAGATEGRLKLNVLRDDAKGIALAIDLTHGHRHQIRAHLALLGCPIRGDLLYGGREAKRLYLHAFLYELNHELEACDPDLGFGADFLDLNCNL